MKVDSVAKRILRTVFDSQEEMASTFLRFQEFYESPFFRGKVFTVEEFKKWYTENSKNGKETGKFTYFEDWEGFNIPSWALEPFYEGKFDPLSEQEKRFLDTFRALRGTQFCILGTCTSSDDEVFKHEVAHGLFCMYPEYRNEVLSALQAMVPSDLEAIKSFLHLQLGYHPEVIDDEAHAYLITDTEEIGKVGIETSRFSPASERLRNILDSFFRCVCIASEQPAS